MFFFGCFCFVVLSSAMSARYLAPALSCCVALSVIYPDENFAAGIMLVYVVSLVVAAFRD